MLNLAAFIGVFSWGLGSHGVEVGAAVVTGRGSHVGLVQALAAALGADHRELGVVDGDRGVVRGLLPSAAEVAAALGGEVGDVLRQPWAGVLGGAIDAAAHRPSPLRMVGSGPAAWRQTLQVASRRYRLLTVLTRSLPQSEKRSLPWA